MKYIVIFEEYSDYNQFEGSWDKDWSFFAKLKEAEVFAANLKGNHNYRNVVGPLTEIK